MENDMTPNITDVDPGGFSVIHRNVTSAYMEGTRVVSTVKPNTNSGFEVNAETTTYTLVIVMLSVVVLLAIAFVLFGLFMKASAFTLTESRTPAGRRHSFLKTGVDFETGETSMFGPSGFGGGFDE